MRQLRNPSGKSRRLVAVRPNAGVEAAYYRAMMRQLRRMNDGLMNRILAAYKKAEPQIGADKSPLVMLAEIMDRLTKEWRDQVDDFAQVMADQFVKQAQGHAQTSFTRTLKDNGFTVQFKPTQHVQAIVRTAISENVNLITGLSENHVKGIQTAVNESVMRGRDLTYLRDRLKHQYGISSRRAALIARDQNNKATSVINRTRQVELGFSEGIWRHSNGGKHPRQSHLKAARENLRFDLKKGAFIDGKWIFPGEEVNCRCYWMPVLRGFND